MSRRRRRPVANSKRKKTVRLVHDAAPTASESVEDVWAEIPRMIGCKGRSCGPVPAAPREEARIVARHGRRLELAPGTMTCALLDRVTGRCTVYEDRPTMCRLWGTTPKMPCVFGCLPERWLSEQEAGEILRRSLRARP